MQQSLDAQEVRRHDSNAAQAFNAAIGSTHYEVADDFIHNPFQGGPSSIFKGLKRWHGFVGDLPTKERVYQPLGDSRELIDSIFGMQVKDIGARFKYLSGDL